MVRWPRPVRDVDERLVSLLSPMSFEAEQYRTLCHGLERRRTRGESVILGVSGPSVGDGKTTTALNLAGTLAQDPATRVLIVDADLRRPSVSQRLGLGDDLPGLADLIADPGLSVAEWALRRSPWNLFVVPAGRRPADPYRILSSPRLGAVLTEARQHFDRIVLDSPPLLAVPDAHVISEWVDGFLLVVGAHRTPRKLLEETLNAIDADKVIGIVFNGDRRPLSGYGKYYRAYGYAQPAAERYQVEEP
jgi:capsular exopolysaccharide synthesis family protein